MHTSSGIRIDGHTTFPKCHICILKREWPTREYLLFKAKHQDRSKDVRPEKEIIIIVKPCPTIIDGRVEARHLRPTTDIEQKSSLYLRYATDRVAHRLQRIF
jgi:hypothetical protein